MTDHVSTAAADPPSAPFVSAGISIGLGTRGLTLGVEVSSGYYSNQSGAYAGAAAGFELAVSPGASEPWGRLYVEAEGGWVAFGAGVGPAWMIGKDDTRVGFQVTPYVAAGSFGECDASEPFTVVAPF